MPQKMHKAASIAVRLLIQGEDEPAHDFTQTASAVTKEVLELGLAAFHARHAQHPGTIKVTGLVALEGSDGEDLFGEEHYDQP
jgi:hypothetical protein